LTTSEADFLLFDDESVNNSVEEICMASDMELLLLDDLGSHEEDYPLRARTVALKHHVSIVPGFSELFVVIQHTLPVKGMAFTAAG
jgi:hypothetical protein